MERLKQLYQYLNEALLDPENNKHYIEDLKVTISYLENLPARALKLHDGFIEAAI